MYLSATQTTALAFAANAPMQMVMRRLFLRRLGWSRFDLGGLGAIIAHLRDLRQGNNLASSNHVMSDLRDVCWVRPKKRRRLRDS
jgi:hypothetical protein